jgi:hypothetical protein
MPASQGKPTRKRIMLYDFEDVNAILAELAEQGTIEDRKSVV